MQPTSFEQACEHRKYDPVKVIPDVTNVPEHLQKFVIATVKLAIIHEDYNEGEEPDWNNNRQRKWRGWWDMEQHPKNNPSGFRFDDTNYDRAYSISAGGSRLCFLREEDLLHATKHHLELFRDMMVIPKS